MDENIKMYQKAYVKANVTKFNMVNCKSNKVWMTDRITKGMSPMADYEAQKMTNIP